MTKIITAALFILIQRLVDKDVMDAIKELVAIYLDDNKLNGEEKKRAVIDSLNDVKNEFALNLSELPGWAISTAIDIAHAYLVVRK